MNSNFYDLNAFSYKDTESFNNTVILLTKVKREIFYIAGFSRPNGLISIGFDYSSKYHNKISEILEADFVSDESSLIVSCNLSNINKDIPPQKSDNFIPCTEGMRYIKKYRKDTVLPFTTDDIFQIIKESINDITQFNENYYRRLFADE